jgi:sec-independent protein translocase protein TatA
MFGLDVPSHWIILAILAMTFFGYKKLPDMTRSFGRSLRIFKTEMKSLTDDTTDTGSVPATTATPHLAAVATEPVSAPAAGVTP